MGEIIDFGAYRKRGPGGMSRAELLEYLTALEAEMALLDEEEPEDMDSQEYEAWGDRREELEDLADELMDLLDET